MGASWIVMWVAQLTMWLAGMSGYSEHYVPTDLGPLHYLSVPGQGDLPPVVMLHGIGSQAGDLYPVAEQLRPYVRKIISLDLPGHGFSAAPSEQLTLEQMQASVYQALDQLLAHEEPVILFGNSLGGWQALRYALAKPEELASLILVSPAGAQLNTDEYRRLQQIFVSDSTQHPEVLIPLLFNEPPFWQGVGAWVLQNRFSAPGVQFLLTRLDPSSAFEPAQLQALKPPTLLIWGQQDRIFPTEVDYFKRHLPAQTQILEPAHFTHSPYLEGGMERELGQMMLQWLKALPVTPPVSDGVPTGAGAQQP